jgi:hypothetical protein
MKRIRSLVADWAFVALSGDPSEYCMPPGSECRLVFGGPEMSQRATTYNNDGFELWLGTAHKWHVFYKAREARRLAWFILWTWWAKSTWFGLKRRIWYWALTEKGRRRKRKVGGSRHASDP